MIRSLFSAAAVELTAQLLKNSPFKIMGFMNCKAYKPPPPTTPPKKIKIKFIGTVFPAHIFKRFVSGIKILHNWRPRDEILPIF